MLLNQCKLDTLIDDVNILHSSTEKHHNILSILTSYINLFYISLITGISEINMPKNNKITNFICKGINSMKDFVEVSLTLYITIISMLLIVISNCSILNPGPDSISVYYQNIHGLLTFSSLGKDNPTLNLTKVIEFQSYLTVKCPDVILLNETWFKSNILSSEIFPCSGYTIFRLDRSPSSHLPDPIDPKEYKLNGGGVLIGIKNTLDMKPKVLKNEAKAEVLSVTLNYKGNKKLCFTTCYRVGTLGENNYTEISKHLQKLSLNKSIKHHIIVGDFNLDSVNWENCTSTSSVQSRFIEIFDNHCLTQLITQPTHYRGKILDIVLTDSPHIVSDICIGEHNEHVKSDHFSVNFKVNLKTSINRRKTIKGLRYNYKKANWGAMNRYLHNIDWHNQIDFCDIFTGWNNFKNILKFAYDQYIPTINVKDNRNLPWFDAEVHKLCIKKERLRSLKQVKSLGITINFQLRVKN